MATGGWTHVLTELSPLDALEGPLRRSARLRYTCLSVSKKYIALGSNTGGVYIFTRDTLKHLQVVYGDVESSPLSVTALSPNDNFVAYSTGSGQVIVMEMNIEKRQKPERVRISSDHVGSTVTCLHWDGSSSKLFVGDNIGKISVCYIPSSKAKTLFIQPSEIILRLDASVVQLDWWGEKLLVSTWTRSYLLNTNRQQYSQIGKKLRDGEFGACFFLEPSSQYPVVYCSRPGSRVWEADFDANVLNTHQFKQLLAIPRLPVIKFRDPVVEFADPTEVYKPQSVGFNKLCRLGPYLITWAGKRVYVFDPVRVRIILWNEQHSGVKDMVTSGTEIYIFLEDQSVSRLHLLPVERCLQLLLAKQVWSVAGELLCYLDNFVAVPFIQKHISFGSLTELVKKLSNEGHCDLADRVQGMMDEMSSLSDSTDADSMNGDVLDGKPSFLDSAVKLPSGIFLVNNGLKPSHETELYGMDDLFAMGGREVFGAMATSQGETIQRCTSVDNLDSGGQNLNTLSGDKSLRKSFSTTALDSMDTLGLHHESAFLDTSQMGRIRHDSQTDTEASGDFTDVCLDDDESSQGVFRVSEQGDNSTWNQGTKGDNPEDVQSRKKEPVLSRTDLIGEVSQTTTHAVVEDMAPVIAEPVAVPRKSGRKKRVTQVDIPSAGISTSEVKVNRGPFRRSASTGSAKKTAKRKELKSIPSISFPIQEEDSERGLYTQVDQDLDTISVDTISSIASEEDGCSQTGEITPDTLSLTDGDNLSVFSSQSRSRTPVFQTDEEVIPSLLQRLSASGVSAEDSAASSKDGSPVSQSSMGYSADSTGSGSPQHSQSPKMALLAVKDSLSSKFSSKTKSLIQTIRKKSPLGKPNFDQPFDQALPDHEEDPSTSKEDVEDVNNKGTEGLSIADPLTHFHPDIDLAKLESSTILTKRRLQDVSLLLNPEALKSLLQDWMTVLHRTLQQLHQDVEHERKVKAMETSNRKRQLLKERRESMQKEKSKTETDESKGRQPDIQEGERNETTHPVQENQTEDTQMLDSLITDGSPEETAADDCSDNNHDVVPPPQDSDGGTQLVLSPNSPTGDGQMSESWTVSGEVARSMQADRIINENNNNKTENLDMCNESDECGGDTYIPFDWEDIFHFNDPFRLSSKLHTDVAELCAICFDAGCHGNISKYISTIPNPESADSSSKDEMSSEQEVPYPTSSDETSGKKFSNGSSSKPTSDDAKLLEVDSVSNKKCSNSFMCESYCDRCDKEMAMFVRCYFHCFSVDQVQKSLGKWKDNWFSTWAAVVKASQAFGKGDPVDEKLTARDYHGATDLLRSFIIPNKHAFLGHVARLFGSSPSCAIEFGAEVPKHISMQDMVNMCRLHSIPTSSSLSKYVQHRLGEMPSYLRLQIIGQLCSRKYLTLTILDSLLTSGLASDHTHSVEPSPGSHMRKIANGDLIDCVLDICAEQNFDEALNACKSNRYWCGCLHLWRKKDSSSWQQMLNLIVRLGDISLLDDSHCFGYLPKTAEEWHYFLQEYTQSLTSQSKTTESNWTNTLTWEGIGELMVKTIGPRVAIMLLQDYKIPEGELNPHFYQTCILESILQRQQRLVVHNMLEKVDTYLWAKKKPHLAPQLLYAVSAEKRGRSKGEDQQEYQKLFSQLSINQSSESRSVEDAEAHWGIAADVTGGCGNCSLPLTETVSHIVPGVIIFTCGHSFHKFCVPLKHCPLCLVDPSLTDDLHAP